MNFKIESSSPISNQFKEKGIFEFADAMKFVKNLPYGRNANRTDFTLVLTEEKGSCSSKHALLKNLANENSISEIKLMLGIFKMNSTSHPKIKKTLEQNQLSYIPEAHTYFKIKETIFDCTSKNSSENDFLPYLITEIEIQAEDVIEKKIQIHQEFLKTWCLENDLKFEKIWTIREKCIQDLSS